MRFLVMFLVGLFCSVAIAGEPAPFDYNGMKIGDERGENMKGYFCLNGDDPARVKNCSKTVAGGGMVYTVMCTFVDGKFAAFTLRFETGDFDKFARAYAEKFGRPPDGTVTKELTTRGGANYENQILTWNTADGKFDLQRYAGKVTQGGAYLFSDAFRSTYVERKESEASNLAGHL